MRSFGRTDDRKNRASDSSKTEFRKTHLIIIQRPTLNGSVSSHCCRASSASSRLIKHTNPVFLPRLRSSSVLGHMILTLYKSPFTIKEKNEANLDQATCTTWLVGNEAFFSQANCTFSSTSDFSPNSLKISVTCSSVIQGAKFPSWGQAIVCLFVSIAGMRHRKKSKRIETNHQSFHIATK